MARAVIDKNSMISAVLQWKTLNVEIVELTCSVKEEKKWKLEAVN